MANKKNRYRADIEDTEDIEEDISTGKIVGVMVGTVVAAVALVAGMFFYQVKRDEKIVPRPARFYIDGRRAEESGTCFTPVVPMEESFPKVLEGNVADNFKLTVKSDYELGLIPMPETKTVWGFECPATYDVKDFEYTIQYQSSDENILTVDENGVVTALSNGAANINVICGDLVYPIEYRVYKRVLPQSVPESISMFTGESKDYAVVGEYEQLAPVVEIEDESIVSVEENGKLWALKQGTTNVKTKLANGEMGTTRVTVNQAVTEIQLRSVSVTAGSSTKVKIKLLPEGCNYGTAVTYEIADTSIATVDAKGNVKGVRKGTTTITATSENGVKSSALVSVSTLTPRDLAQGKTPTTDTSGNYDTSNPAVKAALGYVGKKRTSTEVAAAAAKAYGITDSNFLNKGTQVSPDDMRPGDIVYWEDGGDGSMHLAVYIGDGVAVHGDWSSGITKIASAFYKEPTAVIRLK